MATGGIEGKGGYSGADVVKIDCRRKEILKEAEMEMMKETEMAMTGPLDLYHWKRVVVLMQTDFQ